MQNKSSTERTRVRWRATERQGGIEREGKYVRQKKEIAIELEKMKVRENDIENDRGSKGEIELFVN